MNNKLGVALLALALAVGWTFTSREEAPITAGAFLVYDNAGTQMLLTFSPADGGRFAANLSYLNQDVVISLEEAQPDSRLRFREFYGVGQEI